MIDYNLENRVSRNTASNDLNGPVEGEIVMDRRGNEVQDICSNDVQKHRRTGDGEAEEVLIFRIIEDIVRSER